MKRTVAAASAAALVLAGCGVGPEPSPQRLDARAVPFGLLAPATTTTTATQVAESPIVIYLDRTQGLVPVIRKVATPVSIPAVLRALGAGPSPAEAGQGMTSPISTAGPLTLLSLDNGVVSLGVPSSFEALGGQDQIVAAAQVVFTLTGRPGITGVELLVDGQPTQVPTAGGSLSQGPLTRADYASLGAR